MSVLIEDMTLVVPKATIEAAFRGGIDGFRRRLLAMKSPPRFICTSDEYLITAAFASRPDIDDVGAMLLHTKGLVAGFGHPFPDAHIIYKASNPPAIDWLDVAEHPSGVMHAWPKPAAPGAPVFPPNWQPVEIEDTGNELVNEMTAAIAELPSAAGEAKVQELMERLGFYEPEFDEVWDDDDLNEVVMRFAESRHWPCESHETFSRFWPTTPKATYDVVTHIVLNRAEISCGYPESIPVDRRMAVLERVWARNAEWRRLHDRGRLTLDAATGTVCLTREWHPEVEELGTDASDRHMRSEFEMAFQEADAFHDVLTELGFGILVRK